MILEAIGGILVKGLLGEVGGTVRRKLKGDPVEAALKKAVSEALEDALQQSGLSPESLDHSESFFRDLFGMEAVQVELALLLDPRPDVSLNLDRLAQELEEGGLDCTTLPGFEVKKFLGAFALSLYSAVGKQAALHDLLDLKLSGLMVDRLGAIDRSTERSVKALELLNENVEGLRRELPEFVAGRVNEAALLSAAYTLRAAGMIPAFDGWRLVDKTVQEAGYEMVFDQKDRLRLLGTPQEERALPPARLGALERVAAELYQAVRAQPPSEAELDALAERYRQHVVRWFQHLTFQGMTPSARAIVLPLEEVYVELRAVAEVPEAADSFSVEERRLLLETERDPQARDELMRQLDSLRRERWSRSLPERKSIAAALYHKDQRAFVILGDPGSGKTTLLHFLALVHARGAEEASKRLEIAAAEADRLPIFVPLAAFDDMRRETPGLNLFDFLSRFYDRRRGLPGLEPLFRRALETGRALVLLDGLDEVLESGTRNYVASQAGAFIDEWSPRGVRFAVSSRFVGYREAPVPGSRPTLSVLDFGEKEIEVFVHRWARAYETWAAKEESPETARKARELERDLLEDVRSNESVRRLAANPLMLTLLALLRQVEMLPLRRVQLYESYVSTMLDNWLGARSQGAREALAPLMDRHQAENILIPMTLWLQREKPSGTAGLAEMERQLTDICLIEKGTTREAATLPEFRDAEKSARDFLRKMREMMGLLVARGHDAFGFLHLTFQEYFAGRALARLKPDERWVVLQPHLHDPRWREPILLCAGRLGVVENRREDVTDFVRRILNHEDETEGDLHRNLLLALAIACDDVNLDPATVGELIETAVRCLPATVYAFAEVLLGFLARLVADGAPGASLERCFKSVWKSKDERLRAFAVRSLGRFADKGEIKSLLMERLQDEDEFDEVRVAAIESLAGSAREPLVRRALLDQFGEQFRPGLVAAAIRSVSGLLREDPEVREAVIEQLGSADLGKVAAGALSSAVREDAGIRVAVIAKAKVDDDTAREGPLMTLSGLVAEDAEVRDLFFGMLEDKAGSRRRIAVSALSKSNDDEARRAVLAKLDDPAVREIAFQTLMLWSGTSTEIDSIILGGLRDDDARVRSAAIQALGSRGYTDKVVQDLLIEALADPVAEVCTAALRALVPHLSLPGLQAQIFAQANSEFWSVRQVVAQILGESSDLPEGVQALIEIREKTEAPEAEQLLSAALRPLGSVPGGRNFILTKLKEASTQVLAAALGVLSDSVATDAKVRRAVLDRLGDKVSSVRSSALSALSGVVGSDAAVRRAVLDRLGDAAPSVRRSALSALSEVVENDAEVRRAVLDRLGDAAPSIRRSTLLALSGAVGNDAEVRRAVLDRLGDAAPSIRRSALSALSGTVGSDAEVRRMVLDRLRDEDWSIRRSALSALSGAVGSDAGVRRAVLDHLEDALWNVRSSAVLALAGAVGTYAEVRRAVLDRLRDEDSSVRESALSALSTIVGDYKEVREAVFDRLSDRAEDVRVAAMSAMSGLLEADEDLQGTFVSLLGDTSFVVQASAVQGLLPLSTTRPELWTQVAAWISSDSEEYFWGWQARQVQSVLASVLAPRLPEDSKLTEWVLERLDDIRWSSRLGAVLSLLKWPGYPPREIVDRIFKALEDRRGLESYPARLTAASFLINRNEDKGASINLCLEALDYGTQPWEALRSSGEIRKQAALVLGKLEPLEENQRVYDRLLRVLKEDEDPDVRDAAYNTLIRLAGVRDRQAARA